MDVKQRAVDALIAKYGEPVNLVPAESLSVETFGLEPAGWQLYRVAPSTKDRAIGKEEYVAIHSATGQVRFLGYH